MGPYYITDLVNLLGPVARVQAMSLTPQKSRPIRSEPKRGQMMKVKVATHVTGTLAFVSGALIQVTLSFDVPKHSHMPYEIFGTEAGLHRRELSFAGRRRHGSRHPQRPPAPGERRAGAARARGDGGVRNRQQVRRDRQDQDAGGAAGAIVGVGATHKLSAVRWGIAQNIVWAWILTIPCSAFISAIAWWFAHRLL